MKILICGDRNWKNEQLIRNYIQLEREHISMIIEGGATGADTLAKEAANSLSIPIKEISADWSNYGLAAGPIRNRLMLDENPDQVWVFHNKLMFSKGSKDCVKEALRRKIPVYLIVESHTTENGIKRKLENNEGI